MNQKLKFNNNQIFVDGLTRTISGIYDEPLYGKRVEFKTPNYGLPLTVSPNINMRDIRLEIDHLLSSHTKFYVTKIFDVDNVILNQVKRMTQTNLDGEYSEPTFRKFFFNNIMILDYASESLEYTKNLNKFSITSRLPREVIELATTLNNEHEHMTTHDFMILRDNEITKLWDKILGSTKSLNEFEGKIFDEGINVFGDIITPFTKLIKSKADLNDVKKINEEWIKINRINDKPTVAYLLLHPTVLRNVYLVYEIIEYIKSLKVNILLFKVKNLELTDGSKHVLPRENLKEILKIIAEKKQKEDFLPIVLETAEQIWALSLQAFDVVCASANLYDKETTAGGGISDTGSGYGRAVDEEIIALLEYQAWERAFNRNGFFPCSHDFCRNRITTMDQTIYPNYKWWIDSRIHNILTIDEWMRMVSESVVSHQAGLAFNRLANSPLKVLTELLSPSYNSPSGF